MVLKDIETIVSPSVLKDGWLFQDFGERPKAIFILRSQKNMINVAGMCIRKMMMIK
jgi:hypothetical protein